MLNELLARLDFWWAKQTIKEGRDFGYNNEYFRDSGSLVIEVLKAPYEGVIVELSEFRVGEENGNGRIDFSTRVLYNIEAADVSNNQFNKLITNIVRIILIDSVEKVDAKELYNEDRDTDIVELDEERPVSTEVAAVPKKRVSKRKPRKKTVSRDSEVLPKVQQPTKRKRPKSPTGRQKRPD
jgi:hypothetical protein